MDYFFGVDVVHALQKLVHQTLDFVQLEVDMREQGHKVVLAILEDKERTSPKIVRMGL